MPPEGVDPFFGRAPDNRVSALPGPHPDFSPEISRKQAPVIRTRMDRGPRCTSLVLGFLSSSDFGMPCNLKDPCGGQCESKIHWACSVQVSWALLISRVDTNDNGR